MTQIDSGGTGSRILNIRGGMIGLATLLKLLNQPRPLKVCVLAKRSRVGIRQSIHNSETLHAGICWAEWRRSFSRHLFFESLQQLILGIQMQDFESGGEGVRTQAMPAADNLVNDFKFVRGPRALYPPTAPSPAPPLRWQLVLSLRV